MWPLLSNQSIIRVPLHYYQSLLIKVPSSGTLRKRMEIRTLGLRREGLVCFGKGLKQVCWNQKYTDISDWAIASASFHLVRTSVLSAT